ncbi:MAG: hypothetical protein KGZ63_10005 [Clostridiales bacterium]|jgi:hypothetical protein|nr:hypothetical protein [Clostridiales bacterium]
MATCEEKILSRRKLLRNAGVSLAGITLASSMGFLSGCSNQAAPVPATVAEPAEVPVPVWPLSYVKLDPAAAEQKAYAAYKEDG